MTDLPLSLIKIYEAGLILGKDGKEHKVDSMISLAEAKVLVRIIKDLDAKVTIETGLAFGASALAICFAKNRLNHDNIHYGVDPNQNTHYAGTALHLLETENLSKQFKLLEGPSHIMLPDLLNAGIKIDFAFVDGWHTFDYTLVDFFLLDKLLKPGGLIAFHDMYSLSKQKVLRFILTHRKYKVEKKYRVSGNETFITTIKFFIWRILKYPSLIYSWFHWNYQLRNSSGLIVMRKIEDFEPNFEFYKGF